MWTHFRFFFQIFQIFCFHVDYLIILNCTPCVYYPGQLSLVRRHGWVDGWMDGWMTKKMPYSPHVYLFGYSHWKSQGSCNQMSVDLKDTFSTLMFSGSQTGRKWAPLSYISLRVPLKTYRHQAVVCPFEVFFFFFRSIRFCYCGLAKYTSCWMVLGWMLSTILFICCYYEVTPVPQDWCVHPKMCCFVKLKIMNSQMNNISIYSSVTLHISLK